MGQRLPLRAQLAILSSVVSTTSEVFRGASRDAWLDPDLAISKAPRVGVETTCSLADRRGVGKGDEGAAELEM